MTGIAVHYLGFMVTARGLLLKIHIVAKDCFHASPGNKPCVESNRDQMYNKTWLCSENKQ